MWTNAVALPVTDKGIVMAAAGLATVYNNPSQSIAGAIIITFIILSFLFVSFLLISISVTGNNFTYNNTLYYSAH